VAQNGFLQLDSSEALYPTYVSQMLRTKTVSIRANQAFILDFVGGKPPIIDQGFWSLTVYGPNMFLVPNPLKRYNIGDRTDLTYSDGSPVYLRRLNGSSVPGKALFSHQEQARPFQILLQPSNLPPPSNWSSK